MLRHVVVDLIRELKRHQRESLLKKNRMFRGAHYGIRHNVVYEPPPYAAREAEPGDLQGGWVEGEHVQRVLGRRHLKLTSFIVENEDPDPFIHLIDDVWQGEMPYTVVYDRDGRVHKKLPGAQTAATFEAAVLAALAVPATGSTPVAAQAALAGRGLFLAAARDGRGLLWVVL